MTELRREDHQAAEQQDRGEVDGRCGMRHGEGSYGSNEIYDGICPEACFPFALTKRNRYFKNRREIFCKEWLLRYVMVFMISVSVLLTLSLSAQTERAGQMELPPARKIPGLTTDDKFPLVCVDCHIHMPELNKDERISSLMSKWNKKVESKLLDKAQAVAPNGVTLKGIHPMVPASLKNIPARCNACHSKTSKTASPLAALLHTIHLFGGEGNHFLTIFQGECTHCHKIDPKTGVWSIPSGPEK